MAVERSNPVIESAHGEGERRAFSIEKAREMYRGRMIGPEEIKKAWGIELYAGAVPLVPYSQQTLERLRNEDGLLRLGAPISILQMEE